MSVFWWRWICLDIDSSVLLETPHGSFTISMAMEKVPPFCKSCMAMGHLTSACSRVPVIQEHSGDLMGMEQGHLHSQQANEDDVVAPAPEAVLRSTSALAQDSPEQPLVSHASQSRHTENSDPDGFTAVSPRRNRSFPMRIINTRPPVATSTTSQSSAALHNHFSPLRTQEDVEENLPPVRVRTDDTGSRDPAPHSDNLSPAGDSGNRIDVELVQDSVTLEKNRRAAAKAAMQTASTRSWADLEGSDHEESASHQLATRSQGAVNSHINSQ